MKITKKDLDTVATLSRLSIPAEQEPLRMKELDDFLEYVDILNGVDTSDVKPTTYALPMENVFREDSIKPSLDREAALSNAPLQEDGYFKVPRVLEN